MKKTTNNENVLAYSDNAHLLSYIINQSPVLSAEIDLPVQGQDLKPIGKLIVDNERYRNAFINTVNVISLTVISRNRWENPWDFTYRGTIRNGQTVREMILDLCKVYNYNENADNVTQFLQNEVPNVFQYLHNLNFQVYYETTTSDEQVAMAFEEEGGLLRFIEEAVSMLWESKIYDDYIIDKYQLCRRALEGTMTSIEIEDYNTKTARERVSAMKNISNKLTFRSPNYNPAGIRRATSFDRQIFILNTEFEADLTTEVLATSFFRDEADLKSRMVMADSFSQHDTERLSEVLKDQYVPFTSDELSQLANIPGIIISDEWFQNYNYGMDASANGKMTEFYNPTTLKNNHYLHIWGIKSTSPFENAVVFTAGVEPTVESVTVAPSAFSLTAGLTAQLTSDVKTTGFANKAVTWSITKGYVDGKVSITADGLLKVAKDYPVSSVAPQLEVTATSVFDTTKTGKSSVTVL